MNCCPESSDSDDEQKSEFRECTDVFWFCIFILFWILMVINLTFKCPLQYVSVIRIFVILLQIFVAAFAYVYGNPLQLINGADTFGNVCGSNHNEKFTEFNLSGIQMTEKRYEFNADVSNNSLLFASLKYFSGTCSTWILRITLIH